MRWRLKGAESQKSETSQPHLSRNLSRAVVAFYLAAIALLPWTWFPPFPWLHEHAQWGDVVFAIAAALWALEQWLLGRTPPLRRAHAAIAFYLIFAAFSSLTALIDRGASPLKLLGITELCALAFITSDIASRPGMRRAIARVVAATSLVTAAAAITGLVLFYAGVDTPLRGIYGELVPSRWYARMQAGFYNPNLLASFCIFASAVISCRAANISTTLRRVTLAALWLTVFLTFSRGILGFMLAAAVRSGRAGKRRKLVWACAVVLFAVMVSMTFWRPVINPANPLDIRFEAAASSRYEAFTTSLQTVTAHPLSGSGPGTQPGSYNGTPFDAHCTPLNIAATLGLPALIAFIALLAAVWRKRSLATNLALWGGLAGLGLDAMAQDVEDFRHLWVIIGLADAENPARLSNE
jgi:hypothetical protein